MVALDPREAMIKYEEIGVIVGLTVDQTREICAQTGVEIVSDESPSQQLVGGTHSALEKAFELALELGAREARSLDPYRSTFQTS